MEFRILTSDLNILKSLKRFLNEICKVKFTGQNFGWILWKYVEISVFQVKIFQSLG